LLDQIEEAGLKRQIVGGPQFQLEDLTDRFINRAMKDAWCA